MNIEDKPWRILTLASDPAYDAVAVAASVRNVADALRAEGLRSYAPEIELEVRKARALKGRRSRFELAFPGYLYVRFLRPTQKSLLKKVPGHHGLLKGATTKDFKLSDDEVMAIRTAEVTEKLGWAIEEAERICMEGKKVRIEEGAFRGFSGPVDEDFDRSVKVLVDIFGRMTAVEIDKAHVSQVA